MKKRGLLLLSLPIIVLLLLPTLLADGMIIPPIGPPITEHQQLALISWQNGREHLLLTVQTDEIHDRSAWIVPVPASHTKTVINILPDFPVLYGRNIKEGARADLNTAISRIQMTQIYTIPFVAIKYMAGGIGEIGMGAPALGKSEYDTVTVHEHIEKEGIVTELISATNAIDFYKYLRDQGLEVSSEGIPVLNYYIGQEYTFVVSWLPPKEPEEEIYCEEDQRLASYCTEEYAPVCGSDSRTYSNDCYACRNHYVDWYTQGECDWETYEDAVYPYYKRYPSRRRPAIFVSFPTERPYYPLIPTSIYGSKIVPATIFLVGFYEPQLFQDIRSYTEVSYQKQESRYYPLRLESEASQLLFGQPHPIEVKFTRVDIEAPSKLLNQDLYFEKGAPATVHLGSGIITLINKVGWLAYILFCGIFSAISGLLAGMIAFRKVNKGKFALLGLANLVTIIGLIIATIFVRTKTLSPNVRKRLKKKEQSVLMTSDLRKLWFVLAFTILFVVLTFIFRILP